MKNIKDGFYFFYCRYSFIVGTLVGFVYMFGFISMTPQLFINYKLKSVSHMVFVINILGLF
jgi:hypothetical protein